MAMAERKRKLKLFGHDSDVTDVDIVARTEHVAEYTLSDGAVIRFTAVPTEVIRIDGQWNADGNPIYIVMNGTVTTVVSAPENIRRPGN
jgi:hypothetical protein